MKNLTTMTAWELKLEYDKIQVEQIRFSNVIAKTSKVTLKKLYERQCDECLSKLIEIKHEMEKR